MREAHCTCINGWISVSPCDNIVEQIIENKRNNQYADTSALESEIDRIVHQLYGLTEEEIKMVEES